MLRRMFSSRGISRAAKPAYRPTAASQQPIVRVQHVRIRNRLALRRTFATFVAAAVCTTIYTNVVTEPLHDYLDREYERMSEKEREALDQAVEEDVAIFIPGPFTIREVQPPPYRGSDPEWQEFIKISKDTNTHKEVRDSLVSLILNVASANPNLKQRYGTDFKTKRFWLDIDFPSSPPPEHVQTGLLIDDDGIRLSEKKVNDRVAHTLLGALWPTAVAQSTWAFGTTALRKTFTDIAAMLGYEVKNTPTQYPVRPEVHIQKAQRQEDPDLPPPVKQQTPHGSNPESGRVGQDTSGSAKPNSQGNAGTTDFVKDLAQDHVKTFKELWQTPREAFNNSIRKYWKKHKPFPPRGCIMVSGFIELESKPAFIMMDVIAYWNPKTRKYDMPSMRLAIRRVQHKLQRPAH